MVDFAALGRTGAAFEMDIERGKIREFARATCSGNPQYLDQPRPPVPPTFLTTTFFWEDEASSPWRAVDMDQRRGLHAEQEYVFHGPPPRAGTRLTGQSRIAEIYQKEGRRGGTLTFVVLVTEFRDPSGRLVAEARMTGVETARPPGEPHADPHADPHAGPPAGLPPGVPLPDATAPTAAGRAAEAAS